MGTSFGVHVLPAFTRRPLGTLRRGDIESFAAGLELAPGSARLVLQHLSGMYEAAIADGLVATNPVRSAKRPKVERLPIVPLTADELEALSVSAPPWFAVAVTLGAWCGLRQSEATGLSVDRVDFLRRQLVVNRQLAMDRRGVINFGPPKTPRSYRTVPLADAAVEALARHVELFGSGPDGLVLHEKGRPVHRTRFIWLWQQTRKRASLPRCASTMPATPTPRCCWQVGCRWRLQRST